MARLFSGRLRAMIVKEFWALIRDPKSRIVLFLPPLIQLSLFSFAATLEVKNVDIGILDRSHGVVATEFVSQIAGSPNFRELRPLKSHEELREAIDDQEIIAAVVIEDGFDAAIARGEPARIGVILDGRKSNAAQIVGSYIAAIAGRVGAELAPTTRGPPQQGSIAINWFNPSLEYIWFNLPSLLVIIVSVAGLSITSLTIARERELGTFDQLMVSPLRAHEILIGKMVPTFGVGMINATIFLVAATFLFGVPFNGSLLLFVASLIIYLLSLIGVGMFVSALSMTQQQAFLGSFVVTVPLFLLSGFAAPIDNMPHWLQIITTINPARWFMQISLGLFLKGMPAGVVLSLTWPLVVIATVTLSTSAWLFRARME